MNWTTIGIGLAATLYGVYTLYARRSSPGSFKKLAVMKEFWGERRGYWIHVLGYSVVPILGGLTVVYAGFMGGSLF